MRLQRSCILCLVLWVALLGGVPAAAEAAPPVFVIGTDQEEATFTGMWQRRIYAEAFRRLGLPAEFPYYPTKRLSALVESGELDGEMLRLHSYGVAHPEQVRVGEAVVEVRLALYTASPDLSLARLEDLAGTGWQGHYRRGVLFCENTLKAVVPAQRLAEVTTTAQGLKSLLAGHTAFLCDIDLAVANVLYSPEFQGHKRVRELLAMGPPEPLYPYLHKKNTELAPRLAAVLRQMKAEGLVERLRLEALHDAVPANR
jgi:polar amino acid transport system substrate-binding protein